MTGPDVALLLLRLVVGGVYVAHGARKLGWIGDGRPADFRASIARRGFRPPALWAAAAVGAELLGGGLAVLGLLTPLAGALLLAQSVTIAVLVAPRGFWHTEEGLEYPIVLGVAALAVALVGPGALSLDAALGVRLPGGLAELAVAATVAVSLVSLLARRPAGG